jgi:hypothetical protein
MRISWSAHFDLICRGSKSLSIVGSTGPTERGLARGRACPLGCCAGKINKSKRSGSVRRDDVGFARIRNASYFVTLDLIRL